MSEFDRSSLEGFLSDKAQRRQRIEASIDVIGQTLSERSRTILGQYNTERQALLPEAEERLATVIKPWWQEFEDSGLYDRTFQYLSQRDIGSQIDPVASLSALIVFPWPRVPTGPQDITYDARLIINQHNGDIDKAQEAATQAYEAHDSWGNLWTAHFYIAGDHQSRHDPGFGISRWPIDGGGFAYAIGARRNDIHLRLVEADQLIAKVHPEVIIGFAEQIESGSVYRRLQGSLQPRLLVRTITREEFGRRQVELAERYWQRKQTRNR